MQDNQEIENLFDGFDFWNNLVDIVPKLSEDKEQSDEE